MQALPSSPEEAIESDELEVHVLPSLPEDGMEDDEPEVHVLPSQPYVCPIQYHPVDNEWQRMTCTNLGLSYVGKTESPQLVGISH